MHPDLFALQKLASGAPVAVGPSKIHGRGVFASSDIPSGTTLLDQHLQDNLREYKLGEQGWDNKLTIFVGGHLIGAKPGVHSWQEFLNHQDKPNAQFNTKAELVTSRPIEAGEEITVDYHKCVHPESSAYKELFEKRASMNPTMFAFLKQAQEMIPGGKANGMKPQSFPQEQLALGTKVEREHSPNPQVAREIAMDHLVEKKNYYDVLRRAGLADELTEKRATIEVLTGRTGAGKSTLADKWRHKYDLVIGTDLSRPLNKTTGKYDEPTKEEKWRLREDKRLKIVKAHEEGKSVLVEGHPPGIVKVLKDSLPLASKIMVIPFSRADSFKRVIDRAKKDPGERVVSIDIDSAKSSNKLFPEYFKRLKDSGVPIVKVKTAAPLAPSIRHQEKLDSHFSSHEPAKWRDFRKGLRSKGFVEAVKLDERADAKLKRFAEMVGKHHASKDPGIPVPSSTSNKTYRVKFHSDIDRFSCNCNHWIYDLSHKEDGGDCKHIQQAKSAMEKHAAVPHLLSTARILNRYSASKNDELKARIVNTAYAQNFPKKKRPL